MKESKTNIVNYVLLFFLLLGFSLCFGKPMRVNLADSKSELYEKLQLFSYQIIKQDTYFYGLYLN